MDNNENIHEEQVSESPEFSGVEEKTKSEEVEAAESDCTAVEEEAEAWKNKYLRSVAEFDNYKKRTNKEMAEIIQAGGKSVISSMLEVMDDMDRAEEQVNNSENIDEIKEGVSLVFQKMRNAMKAQGVESFESKGKDFDVELHDAITEIPAPDESMKGKVVDEIQKGYNLNGKLLRYAKVVVGK